MTATDDSRERHRDERRSLYGPRHAARYEDTWQNSEIWGRERDHYIDTIAALLPADGRWLDVGCGTGFFLAQFPGVSRAGIDLSPSMLDVARRANPDAQLREGDICLDVPEWHDQWDLVTSTGQAWGYLATMDEIERSAHNMARWTAPGGVLMVQPADLVDLTGHRLDYDFSGRRPPPNTTVVTGAIWTYYETEDVHRNQIWPSLDQWVEWLAYDFERIEISNWPHEPPPPYLAFPRRVLVASGRRRERSTDRARIDHEPLPGPRDLPGTREPSTSSSEVDTSLDEPPSQADIEVERQRAVAENDEAWASLKAHAQRETARADRLEAELAELRAATKTERSWAARLYDQPLSSLVERYAPWKRRVRRRWSSWRQPR